MISISTKQVLSLHHLMIREFGGAEELRDYHLLDGAINGAFQTFDGIELYPSTEEKGAWMCFSIISNHAFVDGNKRIGILTMLTFFHINGIQIECTDNELVCIGYGIASGTMEYDELLSFVQSRATPQKHVL